MLVRSEFFIKSFYLALTSSICSDFRLKFQDLA